jgi:hypothetical protein
MEVPSYYIGKNHKYEASKVVEDFQSDSYNLGTAITYLLRAGKKTYIDNCPLKSYEEDVRKAIHHLQFELEMIENEKAQSK